MVERTTYLKSGSITSRVVIDPEDVDNPILAFFLTNWRRARGSRKVPLQKTFSLEQAGANKEWVMIVDALPDLSDFRFRYVGEKFTVYFGGDGVGKTLREVFGADASADIEAGISFYRQACSEAAPLRMTTPKGKLNGIDYDDLDALYLPYATHGAKADMVVNVFTFNYEAFKSSRSITSLLGSKD